MDYSNKSDFEINKLVAKKRGFIIHNDTFLNYRGNESSILANCDGFRSIAFRKLDFCNYWNDAGEIILENKISIYPLCDCGNKTHSFEITEYWCAEGFIKNQEPDSIMIKCKNPLRAAMTVYLKMGEYNE